MARHQLIATTGSRSAFPKDPHTVPWSYGVVNLLIYAAGFGLVAVGRAVVPAIVLMSVDPALGAAEPDPEIAALLPGLLRSGREGTYRRVLSTSFGFGGLNAALVLGAIGG